METTIFEIKFIDGRKFIVNCENRHQKDRILSWHRENKDKVISFTPILSGIHSTKQFLEIIKN